VSSVWLHRLAPRSRAQCNASHNSRCRGAPGSTARASTRRSAVLVKRQTRHLTQDHACAAITRSRAVALTSSGGRSPRQRRWRLERRAVVGHVPASTRRSTVMMRDSTFGLRRGRVNVNTTRDNAAATMRISGGAAPELATSTENRTIRSARPDRSSTGIFRLGDSQAPC